jgi:hypothetical protein
MPSVYCAHAKEEEKGCEAGCEGVEAVEDDEGGVAVGQGICWMEDQDQLGKNGVERAYWQIE